jgi:serine/threonine-protein kinase
MSALEPITESRELLPGESLGRYELLLPIAEGGMAVVWAARLRGTRGFSKTVAIKTMLPELSQEARFQKMFLDEARIASRIKHPNVAEILDLGEQDERLYIVLEWVDGEPLANLRRDAVKHGGIPLGVAVAIVRATAAGLHAAHELCDEHSREAIGLVHRDISPQNILVTFDGVVKVVDFGVAKARGRSTEKTSAGHVKGKPPYMSPEQASGHEVDRRTDVFALGIILYQLVTGKHPFRGESDLVTLQNIVSDGPVVPPRAHNRACPKSLQAVVVQAIERDPEARFQTARQFERALEAAAADLPRTRQEDVAAFVRLLAGERGERRRQQLLEATLLAEERSLEARALTPSGRVSSLPGVDPHGRTVTARRSTKSDAITQAGQVETREKRPLPWLALSLFGLLAFGALAVGLGRTGVGGSRPGSTAVSSAPATHAAAALAASASALPSVDVAAAAPLVDQYAASERARPAAVPSGSAAGGLPSPAAVAGQGSSSPTASASERNALEERAALRRTAAPKPQPKVNAPRKTTSPAGSASSGPASVAAPPSRFAPPPVDDPGF